MPLDFYVYVNKKASDGEIFYVGKGRGRRAWTKKRNPFWQNVANKHGVLTEIVSSGLSEQEAFCHERKLIARFGRSRLCNFTDGGEGASGYVWSEEGRQKISENLRGRLCPAETRRRLSEAHQGRPKTAEQIRKQAEAIRGRKLSDTHKAALLLSLKGRPVSDETKAKLSKSNVGKTRSVETRRRLSEAHKGKAHSIETRKKMSDVRKNRSPEEKHRIYAASRKGVSCSNGMRFTSLTEATEWAKSTRGSADKSTIGKAASGVRPSAYGLIWKYDK